jgi:hypothetical protein
MGTRTCGGLRGLLGLAAAMHLLLHARPWARDSLLFLPCPPLHPSIEPHHSRPLLALRARRWKHSERRLSCGCRRKEKVRECLRMPREGCAVAHKLARAAVLGLVAGCLREVAW